MALSNLDKELAYAAKREHTDPVSARELWLTLAGLLAVLGLLLVLVGYLGTEAGQAWMDWIDGLGRAQ